MTADTLALLRDCADTLARCYAVGEPPSHVDFLRTEILERMKRIAAHLETGGWIPVGERLPDEHEIVLIARADNPSFVPPMCAFHIGGHWFTDVRKPELFASHWQPLPPPPK